MHTVVQWVSPLGLLMGGLALNPTVSNFFFSAEFGSGE